MQFDPMQQAQPFLKLFQANVELWQRFATSPEVTTKAPETAGDVFQQASSSAVRLMQSAALAELTQGMIKNYTEFLSEVSQGGMAMLKDGQEALVRHAQEAAETAIDSAQAPGRKARQGG